jgi:predicted nucleic acid-binding protein
LASHAVGLLDTSSVIDLETTRKTVGLPEEVCVCAVTLAELSYGIALAADPVEASRRAQRYARVRGWFDPLPFNEVAADRYGELTALVLRAGRHPRARRMDLMIAAIAVANQLPLYTLNPADFSGLESVLTVVG